jgi:hypothetical protein
MRAPLFCVVPVPEPVPSIVIFAVPVEVIDDPVVLFTP